MGRLQITKANVPATNIGVSLTLACGWLLAGALLLGCGQPKSPTVYPEANTSSSEAQPATPENKSHGQQPSSTESEQTPGAPSPPTCPATPPEKSVGTKEEPSGVVSSPPSSSQKEHAWDIQPFELPNTKPAATPPGEAEAETIPGSERKPPDLGPPLVDDPDNLTRLNPEKPLWIDRVNKQVVMVGQVCQTDAFLEVFACLWNTKEHEAIVTVDVRAFEVHAALLAVGARPGSPAKFEPTYVPASGTEIEVWVAWKDKSGKAQRCRAQEWILDVKKNKPMEHPWVFAGSGFYKDERTNQKIYLAEGGELICVSNFGTAMLDLPIQSTDANAALMFRANREKIPPLGTPVTLILKPKPSQAEKEKPGKEQQQPPPPS
jgi:hypothetical protein